MRNFNIFIRPVFIAVLCLGFISCDDSSNDSSSDSTSVVDSSGSDSNPDSNPMTSNEQKAYLDQVGKELVSYAGIENYREVIDLVSFATEEYEDLDDSYIEDVFEDCLVSTKIASHTESSGYNYTDIYTTYKKLLQISNIKGHFTAGRSRWEYTKADDLQFIFNNKSGQPCSLTMTTSGKTQTVFVAVDEEYDWSCDNLNGSYSYTYYIDENRMYLEVPENLTMKLTENGKELASMNIQIDLSNLTGENIDLAKTNLNFNATVSIGSLKVVVEQVKYTGNEGAIASVKMYFNNQQILSASATAKISCSGNTLLDADNEDDDIEISGASADVNVDVLGKVQLRGSISDAKSFLDYMDKADENDDNETKFKRYIQSADDLLNLCVYYNGGSNYQAKVGLEPFYKKSYYSYYDGYWYSEPVMRFNDGSSYSFSIFFNENDFRNIVNAVENLAESYEEEFD